MKIARRCLIIGILFIYFCVVQVQSSVPRGYMPKIERGVQDTIWYDENYHQLVKITNLTTMTCNLKQKTCRCIEKFGYNTVVYNTNKKIVKCIKDEDVSTDIVGHDGYYLKTLDEKCLEVKNQIISLTKCSEDDLSQRWLWTGVGNLLNLKSLKCLQWNNSIQEFTTEQCNSANGAQMWTPQNNGPPWKFIPMSDSPNARPLTADFKKIMDYKGCYRVSRDKLMVVVKKPICKHAFHKNCPLNLTINAPVFYKKKAVCNIVWKSSMYSVSGQAWKPFPPEDPKMFTLSSIDTERISLNTTNSARLFEQWSGTLIRLSITCGIKEHCVMLKIKGSRENKTQSVSSFTTSAFTSTSISANSASSPNGSQMSSMFFIVPVVVLFCLLIVAFFIVVYYRRRGKRLSSEEDHHLYEECSAKPLTTYEDPVLLTDMQEPTPYDSPGTAIYASNHYERPTDDPDKPISRQKDENGKEFQYDYATREETSILPFILNGDITSADKTSGFAKPRRKQNRDTDRCSDTVDTTGALQPSETRCRRTENMPIYHTLEEDSRGADDNTSAYAEPHENLDLPASDKPVYYTLKEDSPETDDEKSAYAEPHENLDLPASDKPVYYTLKEDSPESDDEKSAYAEPHKNPDLQVSDKPIYHTLEEHTP